jgi:hypothetical protein
MGEYTVKPLGPDTWEAFAQLAERHNGVWNGCWCTGFHPPRAEKGDSAEGSRAYKQRLVSEGRAHAALVFDGDVAVAWYQYGTRVPHPSRAGKPEEFARLAWRSWTTRCSTGRRSASTARSAWARAKPRVAVKGDRAVERPDSYVA